jgi:hypothetical protein
VTKEEREEFVTQVLETIISWGRIRHLKVWRADGKDGITWDQLQCLKNEALGEDVCAIEFYPPEDELINCVNTRHLWEIPPHILKAPMAKKPKRSE